MDSNFHLKFSNILSKVSLGCSTTWRSYTVLVYFFFLKVVPQHFLSIISNPFYFLVFRCNFYFVVCRKWVGKNHIFGSFQKSIFNPNFSQNGSIFVCPNFCRILFFNSGSIWFLIYRPILINILNFVFESSSVQVFFLNFFMFVSFNKFQLFSDFTSLSHGSHGSSMTIDTRYRYYNIRISVLFGSALLYSICKCVCVFVCA